MHDDRPELDYDLAERLLAQLDAAELERAELELDPARRPLPAGCAALAGTALAALAVLALAVVVLLLLIAVAALADLFVAVIR